MLALYLVPLAGAILALHLDRFDPAAPITWTFFAIVGALSLGAVAGLLRPAAPSEAPDMPASGMQRAGLGLLAAVTGLWSLALFAMPDGPVRLIWVWPQDALTSRLIAAMLMTLALAAWLGRGGRRLAMTALGTATVYGSGIALAGLMNLTAGKPAPWGYVLAGAAMAALSAAAMLRPPRSSRPG